MNLAQFIQDIDACRYCFMCRHLAPVANATFRESDTPRVRALIASSALKNPALLENADYAETFYNADLSGANRFHCVSHYNEVGIVLAMRRDLVESGNAPANVNALAQELVKTEFPVTGSGDVLYAASGYAPADAAFAKLMKQAGITFRTAENAEAFKALKVLGFEAEAAESFAKFKSAVGNAATIVCGSTAVYDALQNDYPGLNAVAMPDYLLSLANAGKIALPKHSGKATLLASDFLKNYCDNSDAPQKLIEKLGFAEVMFGTNVEESYSAGEGAVVLDKLNPALVKALADKIAAQAEADVTLIAGSAFTAKQLSAAGLEVKTLEEVIAG